MTQQQHVVAAGSHDPSTGRYELECSCGYVASIEGGPLPEADIEIVGLYMDEHFKYAVHGGEWTRVPRYNYEWRHEFCGRHYWVVPPAAEAPFLSRLQALDLLLPSEKGSKIGHLPTGEAIEYRESHITVCRPGDTPHNGDPCHCEWQVGADGRWRYVPPGERQERWGAYQRWQKSGKAIGLGRGGHCLMVVIPADVGDDTAFAPGLDADTGYIRVRGKAFKVIRHHEGLSEGRWSVWSAIYGRVHELSPEEAETLPWMTAAECRESDKGLPAPWVSGATQSMFGYGAQVNLFEETVEPRFS